MRGAKDKRQTTGGHKKQCPPTSTQQTETTMELLLIIFFLALFGGIGYAIPKDPSAKATGALLGGLLGPIGLVIVAIMNR